MVADRQVWTLRGSGVRLDSGVHKKVDLATNIVRSCASYRP